MYILWMWKAFDCWLVSCLTFGQGRDKKKKKTVALSFFSLLGSWQFFTYSHQSRDKSTLGILKGFILCREGQQSTETSFCRMRRRGRVFLHLIFTHSRSQGYNRSAVLFLSWRGSKWHSTKSCLYSLTPFIFRAYKTSKVSIKWIFFNSWQSLLYLGSLLGSLSLSLFIFDYAAVPLFFLCKHGRVWRLRSRHLQRLLHETAF